MSSGSPDLLLLDIRLSSDPRDRGGLDLLRKIRATGNAVPAVMVTSLTELSQIREAMRSGAQDYVLKDELSPEMLMPIIEGFRERMALRGEVARLRQRVRDSWGVSSLSGSSREMENVRRLIMRVADANATVLIRGETGTGKELVARALHEGSPRRDQPFVAVNCSALPGPLMESLMFGHERGAFTGAERRARGQFELAAGGTILLDEIAEMPADLQAKLLRVLEDRTFRPLGSETIVTLRARVLAATHVDLESRMTTGRFREDLFYRLNVVCIELPSLAEREEDVPELVATFTSKMQRKLRFTEGAMAWLTHRPWHGNVRELRNLIERLVLLAEEDVIDVPTLELLCGPVTASLARNEIDRLARALLALPDRLGSKLAVIERAVLHHAIETCGGNKSAAARMIGLDRRVLERRWERLGDSDPPDERGSGSSGDEVGDAPSRARVGPPAHFVCPDPAMCWLDLTGRGDLAARQRPRYRSTLSSTSLEHGVCTRGRPNRAGPPATTRARSFAMNATTRVDPHVQVRALYSALLENEERFHEFKRQLALYEVKADEVDEEPADAAAIRERLNQRIQGWLTVPFDGISAVQMLQWRAIIVEERFNVSVSPWKESNAY